MHGRLKARICLSTRRLIVHNYFSVDFRLVTYYPSDGLDDVRQKHFNEIDCYLFFNWGSGYMGVFFRVWRLPTFPLFLGLFPYLFLWKCSLFLFVVLTAVRKVSWCTGNGFATRYFLFRVFIQCLFQLMSGCNVNACTLYFYDFVSLPSFCKGTYRE